MGYIGQKMSERAAAAYDTGEKPLSKWTKGDIISRLKKAIKEGEVEASEDYLVRAEKLCQATLKSHLLDLSSWHHTGKYFNCTYFYDLVGDLPSIEKMEEDNRKRKEESNSSKAEKKAKIAEKYAVITYYWTENRGSKKWPKIYECRQNFLAEIKGKAAIISKGWQSGKKVFNYSIVHEFEGKPRKNAKELKSLEDSYSESKKSKWYNY